jgi:hypothetical protein
VLLAPTEDSGGAGHWVTVTSFDPKTNQITYQDGLGQPQTESLDAFLSGATQGSDGQPAHSPVEALTFDADVAGSAAPPQEYVDARSDPGGGYNRGGLAGPSSQSGGTTPS